MDPRDVGFGSTFGTLLRDAWPTRALISTLYAGLIAIAVVVAAFGFLAASPVGAFVAVFLLGASSSVIPPALQTHPDGRRREWSVARGWLNHAARNITNPLGAALGSTLPALGYFYPWRSRVSVVLPPVGIVVLSSGLAQQRRARHRTP